jgi:transcription initiation factor TFIIE subunit alpha
VRVKGMPRKDSPKVIEEIVGELFGEEVIPLVFKLKAGKNISEFKVAKDMKWDIHQARSILYRLHEHGLATFYRKKDKVKGWYICYWDFDGTKLDYIRDKLKRQKLEKLEERLEKEESNDFYMCKNLCLRSTFDHAVEISFKCPECHEIMNPVDNKRTIEFLQGKITELKQET